MIKLVFVLISWVTCGIAAAGIWNASLYENFHNCGRQGAEDQAGVVVERAALGSDGRQLVWLQMTAQHCFPRLDC